MEYKFQVCLQVAEKNQIIIKQSINKIISIKILELVLPEYSQNKQQISRYLLINIHDKKILILILINFILFYIPYNSIDIFSNLFLIYLFNYFDLIFVTKTEFIICFILYIYESTLYINKKQIIFNFKFYYFKYHIFLSSFSQYLFILSTLKIIFLLPFYWSDFSRSIHVCRLM